MKRLCERTGADRTVATTWLGVPVGWNARDDDEADKAEQDPERDAQPMRPFLLPTNPAAVLKIAQLATISAADIVSPCPIPLM